jgi:hypothetical protein
MHQSRSLLLACVACMVAASPATALAQTLFVVGGGHAQAGGRPYTQFAFSAQSGPNGVSGHISLNWPPASDQQRSQHGQLLADVVCLFVQGNEAVLYGVVTKVENGDTGNPIPSWVGLAVTQRGGPGGEDTVYGFFDQNPVPGDSPPCEFFSPPIYPILSGKVVIGL